MLLCFTVIPIVNAIEIIAMPSATDISTPNTIFSVFELSDEVIIGGVGFKSKEQSKDFFI